jgi:hypothetical protein
MKAPLTRSQRATIDAGVSLIVLLMVIMQLWLLTATMNAYLGGDNSVVWPAAAASAGCFAVNFWLLRRLTYLHGNRN